MYIFLLLKNVLLVLYLKQFNLPFATGNQRAPFTVSTNHNRIISVGGGGGGGIRGVGALSA